MTAQSNEHYDVGIVGVSFGANYGSVLTYYSLYKTIQDFGNKVLMVSKIGAHADDPEVQDTHAMRFAREHYNWSKIYNQDTVGELNSLADTFVVGSDQVWNYGISRGFGKSFYLDFANDDKRKISYAASFGHVKDMSPKGEVPKISALMKRFNAISVREDSGVSIAKSVYGVPATQVAEPIFLTDAQHYRNLAARSSRDVSEPYLLAYILDPTPEKKAAIEHVAAKLGLKPRIILDAWPHLLEENKAKLAMDDAVEEDLDTYDFLKLYANSSYVVTDSFHGTAFALRFEKPFASIGNRRRGVARFDSLFHIIGHRERFTLKAEEIVARDADFLAPMDYADIRRALDNHVSASKKWLKAALKKRVRNTIAARQGVWEKPGLRFARRAAGKARRVLRSVRNRQRFQIDAPAFTANNAAWRVDKGPGETHIRVAGAAYTAERGNFVWTDLPQPLHKGGAYELGITWRPHTTARIVKVHLRNPATGRFKVVGSIDVSKDRGTSRTDKISFLVQEQGLSQVMFGALHFGGEDGGADVSRITVRSVSPQSVMPNAPATARKKGAADAVKELSQSDDARFIGSYAQHRVSRNVDNARSLLMYHSHGFEKGLSRSTSFRPGFGQAAMPLLSAEMNKWIAEGRSTDDSFFRIAAAVMKVYFDRHRSLDVDVSHFWKLFDPPVQALIDQAETGLGGALPANIEREMGDRSDVQRDFEDVVFSRRSVREFNSEPVTNDDIERAVTIALQAPSVCNRQPVRIHQFDDPDVMSAVLELQGGFRGYKMPPRLLLVSSDQSAFVAAVERNQAYIDGGLFMMLLLLGLEQVGLGAVSLNTAMGKEKEEAIRQLIKIPESEVFISFVAVGHFDPDVTVPCSKRIGVEEILMRQDGSKN